MPKKKNAGQDAMKTHETGSKKSRAKSAAAQEAAPPTAQQIAQSAPQPARQPAASTPEKPLITIDYPMDGEIVVSRHYTFRITAAEPRFVDVSLDDKQWFAARESHGHWWYDWSGYRGGAYTLSARMRDRNGNLSKTKPRQFTVLI